MSFSSHTNLINTSAAVSWQNDVYTIDKDINDVNALPIYSFLVPKKERKKILEEPTWLDMHAVANYIKQIIDGACSLWFYWFRVPHYRSLSLNALGTEIGVVKHP